MKTYDCVVVGAGPAGSMAAKTAAEGGLETLLVERDRVIGSPVRCAEGVDHQGLTRFYQPDKRWIAAEINRYYLVAPDGTRVAMHVGFDTGYILDRIVFDRMIAEDAAAHGARVRTGVEAVGLSGFDGGGRIVMLAENGVRTEVAARMVVAADGVDSRCARWAGLKTHVPVHDMETCAQVTLAGIDVDEHGFALYFTNELAPGGYAWVFPKGPGVANVGLGISGDYARKRRPADYLAAFVGRYFPGAAEIARTVGGVGCSGGLKGITTDGLLVAGDAAHMANPITGGGIINAMIAGEIAGRVIVKALGNGSADARLLKSYEKECDREFGTMNRRFYRLKEGIFDIPDDQLNAIAHEIIGLSPEKRTPIRVLTRALVKKPSLLPLLAKVVL